MEATAVGRGARQRADINGRGIRSLILCDRLSVMDETIKILEIKHRAIRNGG